jgi:FkbM family methyltransferase
MYNRAAHIFSDSPLKRDLYKLFKKKEKLIILDIGGCEGEDSIKYSRLFPKAAIFVFEPLPPNQKLIVQNIQHYHLNNIELIPAAVSDVLGMQELYISSGHPDHESKDLDWEFGNKSSSLLPPAEHLNMVPWVKFSETITVPVITLNDFMRERNIDAIDFIHMDVQGAELRVMTGANEKIKNVKAIWLEVADICLYAGQPIRTEIERFMHSQGFYLVKSSIYGLAGDQLYLNQKYFKTFSFFKKRLQFHLKK